MMRQKCVRVALLLLCCAAPRAADADAVLLLAEPYGRPGSFNPTGHAGVYLTRVCAETPTVLRRCHGGEAGAVVSRYNRVGEWDWVAIPLIPYLYAVERAAQVPAHATPDEVWALRDEYRRAHLRSLVPDLPSGETPRGNWTQLVGAVYDRRITAFSVKTTPEQDDAFIAEMNARENRHQFNILFRNCADFARDLINYYHPRAIRSSFIADLGLTTPKQITKALVRYGAKNADAGLTAYLIPQIPGNRPESGRTRGVLESLVKTKKYAVPLTVAQPWVPVGLAAGYLVTGRFNPQRHATQTLQPADMEQHARTAITDAGTPVEE